MEARWQSRVPPLAIASVTALAAFLVANGIELAIIRGLRPPEETLTWISDIVLATALGAAVYLWLHLRAAQSALTRMERARVAMDTQLSLAAEIQRNLLPPLPKPRDGWRFAARFEPALRVGGDFYDFVDRGPGQMTLLLADVSGKGIPAALFLGVIRTQFRALAEQTDEPADLASRLSHALYRESGGVPYATGMIATIDLTTATLHCVNAGHPPGLVLSPRAPRAIGSGGPPFGLLPGSRYLAETIELAVGEMLLLYTDGISEAVEDNGGSVEKAVRAVLTPFPSVLDLDAFAETVMELARRGSGPRGVDEWQDDRTVVVAGRT